MVGARSGWGAVWFLLLWRSTGLVWVVFLEITGRRKHMKADERRPVDEEESLHLLLYEGLVLYLKRWPVHMHPRAVVVAEPLQVFLCVCSQDRALEFSVYCGIAEERKSGTKSDNESARREPELLPIWPHKPQCSKCGLRVIQHWVRTRHQCLPEFTAQTEALSS